MSETAVPWSPPRELSYGLTSQRGISLHVLSRNGSIFEMRPHQPLALAGRKAISRARPWMPESKMRMIAMNPLIPAVLATFLLAGCSTSDTAELKPIPGSITYGGQPRTKLTKSPIGSTFTHNFRRDDGTRVVETYQIQPDRSLRIIDRRIIREWLFGRDD